MKKLLILGFLVPFLWSCEKEEKRYAPSLPGVLTAGMGDDYSNQIYFNIQTGQFVAESKRDIAQLSFDAGTDGSGLWLNSANYMFVKASGSTNFESVTDTFNMPPKAYDYPSGDPNRASLKGLWNGPGQPSEQVMVLVMGFDAAFNDLGLRKIQVTSAGPQGYTLRHARLDGTDDRTLMVPKDVTRNRIHANLSQNTVVVQEPESNNWHLHFTQYTDYDITDQGDTIPYLVRGVLLNPNQVQAAKLEGVDFAVLSRQDAEVAQYSRDLNTIGWDWKIFTLASGEYEVVPNRAYFLKDAQGNFYKLRFVEYYNDQGEKGYAKFEIISL
jgi:hypothetical protein